MLKIFALALAFVATHSYQGSLPATKRAPRQVINRLRSEPDNIISKVAEVYGQSCDLETGEGCSVSDVRSARKKGLYKEIPKSITLTASQQKAYGEPAVRKLTDSAKGAGKVSGMSKAEVDAYIAGVKVEVDAISKSRLQAQGGPVIQEQAPLSTPETSSPTSPIVALEKMPEPVRLIKGEADAAALFSDSTFPIEPAELIQRTKDVIELGFGTKDGGACLAEDFEFIAAVVGPLGREEYLGALANFKLEDAFPDMNPQFYGWSVDPFATNRVMFFSRSVATHTEPFMGKPATGKRLELPPQCFHVDFNDEGLIRELGFYVVDRRVGNTGGLGGAFGYMYGTGNPIPIPECQPYKKSKRFRLLSLIGRVGSSMKRKS